MNNKIKIIVVEDNEFYNSMLSRQLEYSAKALKDYKAYDYEILSYTSVKDCLRNISDDINIAFLDYYLGEGFTAFDVMEKIKEKCPKCKIIIISRTEDELTASKLISNGAMEFLAKDKNAFLQSGYILEDIIRKEIA
jgi:DNA-binding NtrC family response regulator